LTLLAVSPVSLKPARGLTWSFHWPELNTWPGVQSWPGLQTWPGLQSWPRPGQSSLDQTKTTGTQPPETTGPSTGSPNGAGGAGSNADYCALDSGHTMCKYQGPSAACTGKTIFRQLDATGKQAILDKHNELRRKVAKGEEAGQPAAANMKQMVWNDELEAIAQRWADQCEFGHDSVRTKLDGTSVGQNAYIGYSSAAAAEATVQAGMGGPAQNWYDEVTNPGFSSANISPFVFDYGAGHYTQVVWAESEELGCAVVYFKDSNWYKDLVICNYWVAGNMQGASMYTAGAACSPCPAGYSCNNGLCSK